MYAGKIANTLRQPGRIASSSFRVIKMPPQLLVLHFFFPALEK
jgi:hypothetical protein